VARLGQVPLREVLSRAEAEARRQHGPADRSDDGSDDGPQPA
jgi:hypothetical protein